MIPPTKADKPSLGLRAIGAMSRAYAELFAVGPAAPLLSRSHPVRRTGFDLDLVVERITKEADEAVSLTLVRPTGENLPAWIPGAHLDVFLPSGMQRQYSICGDPLDLTRYRIAVRRIADGGGGSIEVHDTIGTGDTLHVRGPRNAFTFIDAESYLFIAGGIGITPILPMVRATAAVGKPFEMVYLGRSRATMPFQSELAEIAGSALDIRPDDEVGLPDVKALLSRAKPGAAVYVCGPPPLLDAAKAMLPTLNPTGSLHTERFSARPVVGGSPFEIKLERSGKTVQVAADETALAAIRRELPGVRYSCQQGFCGTCKVRVLDGAVDHRDQLLLDDERKDSMLTCVSRAAGNSLVLDL